MKILQSGTLASLCEADVQKTILRFCSDQKGNIAILTAATMMGGIALTGAAVDYARAMSVRTALQAAADATAIMLAQNLTSIPADQLQTQGSAFLQGAFYKASSTEAAVSVDTSRVSQKSISVTATALMPTTLTQVIGFASLEISATAQAVSPQSFRHRISMVLDNSGSMDSKNKMKALQSASTRFLSALQSQAVGPDDIYVSIIPFNDQVNIGDSFASAWWVDWTDWDNSFGAVGKSGGTTNSHNHPSWKGCVNDRGNSTGPSSGAYDTNVAPPVIGNTATYFAADNPKDCPEQVMALSNDFDALIKKAKKMQSKGNTNQAIGLAHGWLSLVGGGPYPTPPVEAPSFTYQKSIIILSDGENTYNRWYSSETSINNRQKLTCDNIKAAGIAVFAIQVNTSGDPTSPSLQNCASDSSKFYQLSSASQMDDVFDNINTQLNTLRLTR